jgi:CRISPR-associated endoribonuclease Cas6
MRLLITLAVAQPTSIPIDYQEYLMSAVYHLVSNGDADYARFVHDEGYSAPDDSRRFKPFTHSWLRLPGTRREISGNRILLSPGTAQWQISSPLNEFLQPFVKGLLALGALRLGDIHLPIEAVQALDDAPLGSAAHFKSLSPIVATLPRKDGGVDYIRPLENPDIFSETVRKGLVAKYEALYKSKPSDERLTIEFDRPYLERRHGGTKLIRFKGIDIIGILAPFTATGSEELITLGYSAGFGSKCACGFGCVEKV